MNFLTNYHSNNIFHIFKKEVLPLSKMRTDQLINGKLFIIDNNIDLDSNRQKWRYYLLSGIFSEVNYISEKNICMIDKPIRITPEVAFASHEFIDYMPNAHYIELIDNLKFNLNSASSLGSYVLLNQRDFDNRYLIDLDSKLPLQEYLTTALAALNIPFKWCNFSTIPPEKQIQFCQGAKVFISAHGAGLTNLAFTPNQCLILEYNLRKHWHCDPVCDQHYSGELSYDEPCEGKLTYKPYFHKADYHNLSRILGKRYSELDVDQYEGYQDRNPISRKQLLVDGKTLVSLIQNEVATSSQIQPYGETPGVYSNKPGYKTLSSRKLLDKYVSQSAGYKLKSLSIEAEKGTKYLISHRRSGKTFPINETTAIVWKCCHEPIPVADLIKLFTDSYPQNNSIKSDINSLLDQLQKQGLVYFFNGPR